MATNPWTRGESSEDQSRPAIIPLPDDRLPPQNLEAERGVLGAILKDNTLLPEVLRLLRQEFFYRDSHQIFFGAIRELYESRRPVDSIVLADEIRQRGLYDRAGGDDALVEILNSVPHAANAIYHAQIVRQKATVRGLIFAAQEILKEGYANLHTADQQLSLARRRIEMVTIPDVDEQPDTDPHSWPAPPRPEAYYGLAGDIVRKIDPHTEADPIAILVQFLVAYGNVIGRKAYWEAEATRHYGNLFTCIVGASSRARKGTSWDHVRRLLGSADACWDDERVKQGLVSGEGLIHNVRDDGVADQRLMIVETEFAGILSVMSRDGNNLSSSLRRAWECGRMGSLAKNNPTESSDAHISVNAHCTVEEARVRLPRVEIDNGLANRFLWPCVQRSKRLPRGGQMHRQDVAEISRRIMKAVEFGQEKDRKLDRDAEAEVLWENFYYGVPEDRPGALGKVICRAEPQAMRLAMLYALLDRSAAVRLVHLEAALALWDYCERSACYIFGDMLGDPLAEQLLREITKAGGEGLSRSQIARILGRNTPTAKADRALDALVTKKLVYRFERGTGGRPAVVWSAQKSEKGH